MRADRREAATEPTPPGSDRPYRPAFYVLAASAASFALLQSMIIPVLVTIQGSLHTSANAVTWVLTGYLLSASVCTPIVGRIGDMFGKRRILIYTLLLLALGSILAALATNIEVMVVARVIQGAGGGVLPLSFGLVRDLFPEEKVPGTIGIIAALTSVGGGIGIAISGPILTALNFHWLFWLPGGMVLLTAIAAILVIPDTGLRSAGRISWPGVLLLAGWLITLLLGVSEAPVWGWRAPSTLGLLVAAAVIFATWIWAEMRSDHPLIDMKMMRIPTIWTTNAVAFLMGAGMYAAFAFTPEFIQTAKGEGYGFGVSTTQSGLLLLPQAVTGFIFGISSGWLTRTFGAKRLLMVALVASASAFILLTVAHSALWQAVLALTVLGGGFGAAFAGMAALVVGAVPSHQTGVASGMNANIRTVGGAIGSAVVSSLVSARLNAHGLPLESGYTNGFLLLFVVTAFAVVGASLIPGAGLLSRSRAAAPGAMQHAELAVIAGGTLAGADPE
jgi:EmrB/QacA subfamily drug resistance transporter